ncbi:conserved protein of unknown function [Pseudorhizobium banfieldiae]|uniref:DUF2190 family protein n=1 Tax=Pseudorhizobium banfieldiae TaxID=1125847 RepID=L0NFV1_9HYPH|nr:DUF2190 family protein [Pseudorhizobium banfieldiae]CAD6606210.1 hypothetical protein RNT25_01812 [arsenite-oxidising bacterium NT-25]CCF19157.1 conserved protein of unknown function [Pseudorhizobium banfieldiae]
MRNFIQPGKVLTAVAPSGGVVSGQLVQVGLIIGVAATSAAEGEQYELALGEVYELPKVSAQAWTMGAAIYMDATGIATTVATDNTKIGVAAAAAANPSGSGLVRLNDNF